MNIAELETLVNDQTEFRKVFRKDETIELLKGNFKEGRLPFIHQATLPSGAQIRLKFYNVVKRIYNTKGLELSGKESSLSYLDVSVVPVGIKGYSYTVDVSQNVWGTSKSSALIKHEAALNNLIANATALGISLEQEKDWCKTYSENY